MRNEVPTETLTEAMIRLLRDHAASEGDADMVLHADCALRGSPLSRETCATAISGARLMNEARPYVRVVAFAAAATLYDHATGEEIRAATITELGASAKAAEADGGSGVIVVNGRNCYVME